MPPIVSTSQLVRFANGRSHLVEIRESVISVVMMSSAIVWKKTKIIAKATVSPQSKNTDPVQKNSHYMGTAQVSRSARNAQGGLVVT